MVELEVGLQLCDMIGYNRYDDVLHNEDGVLGHLAWEHIVCDGFAANLESVWYVISEVIYVGDTDWAYLIGSVRIETVGGSCIKLTIYPCSS